jgi:ubiquinone/menaquinone biosynthesis C-methylase UbiE
MILDQGIEVSTNQVRDYYDRVAETWDATEGAECYNPYFARQLRDHLRALLADSAGKPSALELGAGTGPYVDVTAPLFGKLIAADVSRGMLAVLERRIEQLGLANVVSLQQDACDLRAIQSASVDVVYSVGLLEIIADFHRLFAEVHRVLKPSGVVAGVTSNGDCPWYRLRRLLEGGERHGRTGQLATARNLNAVLQRVGFTVPEIVYWGAVRPQMQNRMIVNALATVEKVIAPTPAACYLGALSFRSRKPATHS